MTKSSLLFNHGLDAHRLKNTRSKLNADVMYLFDYGRGNMVDKLKDINKDFTQIAEIGRQPHSFHDDLHGLYTKPTYEYLDITSLDQEIIPFQKDGYDLVLSNLCLHHMNDLVGFLIQSRMALQKDGLFLVSLLGGETLHELKASLNAVESQLFGGISPRTSPMMDIRDAGALMQRAGFALPVIDREKITVTYTSALSLMKELKAMGQNNILTAQNKKIMPRDFFPHVCEYYQQHFGNDDGTINATFEFYFLTGWKPDASQQQPLKPGSAQKRLSDALNTAEKNI